MEQAVCLDSNNQALENVDQEVTVQKANEVPPDQRQILEALNEVEKDSVAIEESYGSLFLSLRLALSEVTKIFNWEHMHYFNEGRLQESAPDAATKGNRFLNSCLRLKQEPKGIENLAIQLVKDPLVQCWCIRIKCESFLATSLNLDLMNIFGSRSFLLTQFDWAAYKLKPEILCLSSPCLCPYAHPCLSPSCWSLNSMFLKPVYKHDQHLIYFYRYYYINK